jgi:shikimate kinase
MSTIVILGHSGSGKTSVGAWIAKHLAMQCIDTDVKVLEHLGKTSIQSVWDEKGEASWLEAEAEIIPGLLKKDTVVILGGQTSMPASVKDAIANMPMSINCVADDKTTLARIAKCEDRLVRDVDEVQVRSERVKEYGQLATHELDTNGDFAFAIPRIKALLAVNPKTNQ